MLIRPYITAVVCAVFFSSGSTPVWLCVRTDGLFALKANAEAPCESACSGESDDQDANVPVADSVPDNCCLDIPIGLDGKHQPAQPTRPQKADSSPAATQMAALCTLSVPTAAEFGLLTQSQPPGSSRLSFLIRTVVLLI